MRPSQASMHTYLFLLLIEVVNNNTNEEVQGKEGAKDDKNHEVKICIEIRLKVRLLIFLLGTFLKREKQLLRGENFKLP